MLAERMKELAASPKLQMQLASTSAAKAAAFAPSRFIHETLCIYRPWVDRPSHLSELSGPWPDITPSMAKTTSCPSASFPFQEQDTFLVPPAFVSPPPE
jgi:hypothetical protein